MGDDRCIVTTNSRDDKECDPHGGAAEEEQRSSADVIGHPERQSHGREENSLEQEGQQELTGQSERDQKYDKIVALMIEVSMLDSAKVRRLDQE